MLCNIPVTPLQTVEAEPVGPVGPGLEATTKATERNEEGLAVGAVAETDKEAVVAEAVGAEAREAREAKAEEKEVTGEKAEESVVAEDLEEEKKEATEVVEEEGAEEGVEGGAKEAVPQTSASAGTAESNTQTVSKVSDRRKLQNSRQQAVKDAMMHAWRGYERYAMGHDELRPVHASLLSALTLACALAPTLVLVLTLTLALTRTVVFALAPKLALTLALL
jgi:hypothetical protein